MREKMRPMYERRVEILTFSHRERAVRKCVPCTCEGSSVDWMAEGCWSSLQVSRPRFEFTMTLRVSTPIFDVYSDQMEGDLAYRLILDCVVLRKTRMIKQVWLLF